MASFGRQPTDCIRPSCGNAGFSASTFIWVCRRPKLSEWKSARDWAIAQSQSPMLRPRTVVLITLQHMHASTVANRGNCQKTARRFAHNAANPRTSWAGRSKPQKCPTRSNGRKRKRCGLQVIASFQTLAGERWNPTLHACARWRSLSGAIHSIHFECRIKVHFPPRPRHSSAPTRRDQSGKRTVPFRGGRQSAGTTLTGR